MVCTPTKRSDFSHHFTISSHEVAIRNKPEAMVLIILMSMLWIPHHKILKSADGISFMFAALNLSRVAFASSRTKVIQ